MYIPYTLGMEWNYGNGSYYSHCKSLSLLLLVKNLFLFFELDMTPLLLQGSWRKQSAAQNYTSQRGETCSSWLTAALCRITWYYCQAHISFLMSKGFLVNWVTLCNLFIVLWWSTLLLHNPSYIFIKLNIPIFSWNSFSVDSCAKLWTPVS